jgi:adenylate cyclase
MRSAICGAIMQAMTDKVKRRLTTVLCADVHGYSRLMEADEARTLGMLHRYRAAMTGLVERHDGRIVNTWGDAVIAEFASVVEAVQCAVEIQQEVSNQDAGSPQAYRMRFRIGINLGDVMVEGSDIYGDGVNIAARLQELAEPGQVVVSGSVYDQVHNKLSLGFDCLGQQQMKNLVAPVMSYRVTMSGSAGGGPRFAGSTPQTDGVAAAQAGAPLILDRRGLSRWMRSVSDWLANLPRPIAVILVVAGFLVLINVFSGLHTIWFHWPVGILLFIVILRAVLRRKPASNRKEDRPRDREQRRRDREERRRDRE